ncbi:DUF1244 domain-containing protein [Candidatus Pelagibacter sp.]|nr:DUF1244 domain-containing protein [Candidatus Pelagibacter sp.]
MFKIVSRRSGEKNIEISDLYACEHMYGVPYPEWKGKYQQ